MSYLLYSHSFEIYYVLSSIPFSLQRLVFWHQEVASDSFCFLIFDVEISVVITCADILLVPTLVLSLFFFNAASTVSCLYKFSFFLLVFTRFLFSFGHP